jgi:carboxylesterase
MVTEETMSRLKPTWQDWSSAIKKNMKISALDTQKLVWWLSSTGGTLLLELVSSGYFNSHLHPQNLFLDAIVVLQLNCSQLLV